MSVHSFLLPAMLALGLTVSQAAAAENACSARVRSDSESTVLVRGLDGAYFDVARDLTENYDLNAETASYLSEFNAVLKALGTTFIAVPVPPRAVVLREKLDVADPQQQAFDPGEAAASYDRLLGQLGAAGILTADLRKSQDSPSGASAMFARDMQWTPEGARAAAHETARLIRSGPLYSGLLQRIYRTEQIGVFDHQSEMAQMIQQSCSSPVAAEQAARYRTRMDAIDTAANAPSGRPLVVVAGSLNARNANGNFDGFLSEFANLAVINRSVDDPSPYAALITVLSDPAFLASPPPYLVWEFPAEAKLNYLSSVAFRQVLAGTVSCAASDVAWVAQSSATSGDLKIAVDTPPPADQPATLLVDVANDPSGRLDVRLRYSGGEVESLSLGSGHPQGGSARYATGISREIDGQITSVEFVGLSGDQMPVSARLCSSAVLKVS